MPVTANRVALVTFRSELADPMKLFPVIVISSVLAAYMPPSSIVLPVIVPVPELVSPMPKNPVCGRM